MQLSEARILLTGSTGGLGEALARQLAAAGARLLLAGRDAERLASINAALAGSHETICAELTQPDDVAATVDAARRFGVNVLINNAGVGSFGMFEQQDWPGIERILATNLEAPMRLTHALLPLLRTRRRAAIVSIGSTFGSLPFPGFAAYSAAKAGLRGFSQALRRELSDSAVAVIHLAPRAIDTPMNSPEVKALNLALGNSSDSPEAVARQVLLALVLGHGEHHFGFPEKIFAWLNGIAPSLIDRALAGKLPLIKRLSPTH
jgi:short-subunit dehydrogenase